MAATASSVLRQLGSSDLLLSPLGLGCWQFSNGNGMIYSFSSVASEMREMVGELSRVWSEKDVAAHRSVGRTGRQIRVLLHTKSRL
ncbi:hypothetical protein [Brevibacillus parabrevis]|uniref:hypothetical protein n=1 Tax=Brevibacillus parabrevis TaxID=54914 RepID=UPI001F44C4CE|nr:hypothetical protein [Brevibacillus parabrevis]MED2253504.1 hypothetical protein [Brevibacillus parabrevis]WDV95756.1 hypothetical protein PSE45_01925 [Brevibacillus parabrevis]